MAHQVQWLKAGEKFFQHGVDQVVLYPVVPATGLYGDGVPWNGVTAINESPVGGDPSPKYADNRKYLTIYSVEELNMTLDAYAYPPEFEACDGTASPAEGMLITTQDRTPFGLSYRTKVGNESSNEVGYKYHFVYGCKASPSQKGFATDSDQVDGIVFSWNMTTEPVDVPGHKTSPTVVVDSTKVAPARLTALLDIVYGKAATTTPVAAEVKARLPLPAEIISILTSGG